MTQEEIKQAFFNIGIALNINNRAVATDRPNVDTWDVKWVIDNDKEIAQLDKLQKFIIELLDHKWYSLN